jgi:hypothetical protein
MAAGGGDFEGAFDAFLNPLGKIINLTLSFQFTERNLRGGIRSTIG